MANTTEIKEYIESATHAVKYTPNGIIEKPLDVILEWINEAPEHIRSFSPQSGRFLTTTSLYKIISDPFSQAG